MVNLPSGVDVPEEIQQLVVKAEIVELREEFKIPKRKGRASNERIGRHELKSFFERIVQEAEKDPGILHVLKITAYSLAAKILDVMKRKSALFGIRHKLSRVSNAINGALNKSSAPADETDLGNLIEEFTLLVKPIHDRLAAASEDNQASLNTNSAAFYRELMKSLFEIADFYLNNPIHVSGDERIRAEANMNAMFGWLLEDGGFEDFEQLGKLSDVNATLLNEHNLDILTRIYASKRGASERERAISNFRELMERVLPPDVLIAEGVKRTGLHFFPKAQADIIRAANVIISNDKKLTSDELAQRLIEYRASIPPELQEEIPITAAEQKIG